MADDLLTQLKAMTTVVADTGDIEAIRRFQPTDATTNPSLILQAAQQEARRSRLAEIARSATDLDDALDAVAVDIGSEISGLVPGYVSTEVSARLSFDTDATLARAHSLIERYARHGVERERILIKVAATWEGIRAARQLERERHPHQPHPAVQLRPGPGLCRCRRHPDLPLRGAHPRLAQGAAARRRLQRRQRPRRALGEAHLRALQGPRLPDHRDGRQLPQQR